MAKKGKPKFERAKTFTEGELRSLADVLINAGRRIRDEADVAKDKGIESVKVLHGTGLADVVEEKLPDFLADLEKKVRKAVKQREKFRLRRLRG